MAKLIGLVLVSLILASPRLGDAACSWMLWQVMETGYTRLPIRSTQTFTVVSELGSHEACREEATRHTLVKRFERVDGLYGLVRPYTVIDLQCWPATVDPRGASR